MPRDRFRQAVLAAVALLAGCGRVALTGARSAAPAPPEANCRVGPDGGPTVADRGIGGTGGPVLVADRGIGGTGIVAVITGFASVCLAGQEVALPADAEVSIESEPASPDALRAGQVAVIEAEGAGERLSAARIAVRYEVSGPVETASGESLRVAGQDVLARPDTWGVRPAVGEWVAVSGLRRPDGSIEATRLDRRGAGRVLVRGRLRDEGGVERIGALAVRPAPNLARLAGEEVTASGRLASGVLVAESIAPDVLAIDPGAFFGPAVRVFYVEGFAAMQAGRLRLGPGFSAAAPGLRLDRGGRAVLRLERAEDGLRAVGVGPAGFGPEGGGRARQ